MAGSIIYSTKVIIADNDGTTKTKETTKTISYTAKEEKELSIAAAGTKVLWDPTTDATEGTATFTFMYIKTDGDLDLEFTTFEGDANEELNSMRIVTDLPLALGADDSYYNHSASDIFAGTLDVIDKIRAKNNSTSDAVIVHQYLYS